MQNLFFNLVVLTLIISHYTLQAQTNNPQPAPDIVYCTPRPFNGVDPLTLIFIAPPDLLTALTH
ncbi:MAG: hypothetical protein OT643_14955 [Bacteroidetes bacterium]|nr:hypothetical protein [Bacteroidota bacterium]